MATVSVTQSSESRPHGVDRTLHKLARRQHALLTYGQLRAIMGEEAIRHAARRGSIEHLRTRVYRLPGSPETWEQHVLAACFVGGPGSVASFRTAARLWALPGIDSEDPLEITTPTRRRSRIPGVTVHDSFILDGWHITRRSSIPVTSPARTLCDLTASWPPWDVEKAVDEALRRKHVTLRRLKIVFLDLAHRGRRRSTVMRAILEARLPGFDPGESPMEDRIVRWIVSAGLPRPVQQHRVVVDGTSYRLDLAYPELKIGVEYDGWDAHRPRSAFVRDRARQNPLEILGWVMLRYTSASTRDVVVTDVRAAIAARMPSV